MAIDASRLWRRPEASILGLNVVYRLRTNSPQLRESRPDFGPGLSCLSDESLSKPLYVNHPHSVAVCRILGHVTRMLPRHETSISNRHLILSWCHSAHMHLILSWYQYHSVIEFSRVFEPGPPQIFGVPKPSYSTERFVFEFSRVFEPIVQVDLSHLLAILEKVPPHAPPRQERLVFIAEQPAPAPHLAHPEGNAAIRIVLVTVPRVSSCEHFPDGFDLHLLPDTRSCHATIANRNILKFNFPSKLPT